MILDYVGIGLQTIMYPLKLGDGEMSIEKADFVIYVTVKRKVMSSIIFYV